ncbi:MAG: DUF3100 domain-containing protein [Gordonia sp. (in: high G+C Gram-positive bacteria)]
MIVVQFIGSATIGIGRAEITLFPMVWALLAGGLISAQRFRPLSERAQAAAESVMAVAVIFLVARLAFTVGPNIGTLFDAGPALLLQEFGHLFGTVLLALPIAVLLRMGRATVGATFSVDREPSIGIIAERYGPSSDEYRGVLSMYVFGTIFGALIVTFLASLVTSFDFFDPLALAMGAGIGSGSMMAAAAGAIADAHPEQADAVLGMAATSNLITGVLGTYVGVWIALPLADWLYRKLTRTGKVPRPEAVAAQSVPATNAVADTELTDTDAEILDAPAESAPVGMIPAFAVLFVLSLVATAITAKGLSVSLVVGLVIVTAVAAAGILANRYIRFIPAVILTTLIGTLLSVPVSPVDDVLGERVATLDFLSMCAVVLALAGLSLGTKLPQLRSISWRIVPVGLVAVIASFLLSTIIAEFTLGAW